MCPAKYIFKILVFYAYIVLILNLFSTLFIQSYTSPIEDSILKKGIFTETTYALFVTASYVGATISCLLGGPISEWLGIKSTNIVFSPLSIIGGMLLVVAYDSISMILGRFMIGLFIGIPMSLIPIYISEIVPTDKKKFYGALLSLAIRIGVLLSYTLGIWIGYRWLACIYLMMVVFIITNQLFIPESPKWLRKRGWIDKANRASEYFQGTSTECEQNESDSLLENKLGLKDGISLYFTWPILRPMLICASLQVYRVICGYMLLMSYSAHVLETGVSVNPNVVICIFPTFQLIGCLIFVCIIQKVNWKILLLLTTFVQMIAMGFLGLSFYLSTNIFNCTQHDVASIECNILQFSPLPLVAIFGLGFSLGWGSLSLWLYGQILHTHYSRLSASIATLSAYIAECFNQLIAPILVEYLGSGITFFLCSLVCLSALPLQCCY